jgi:hypothetical protein
MLLSPVVLLDGYLRKGSWQKPCHTKAKPAKPEPKRKHKIYYLTGMNRINRIKNKIFAVRMNIWELSAFVCVGLWLKTAFQL